MKRLTQKAIKTYTSSASAQELCDRLAQYEDMQEAIEQEDKMIEEDLESLRLLDKTKSARFREAFGHRLMHQTVMQWLKKFRLLDK